MGDGAVGQHPLERALRQGDQVAHHHGRDRKPGDDRLPEARSADGNASMSTRTSAANAAAFTPVAMNPVTGVGDAVVHVRRPHVERHRRDLEAEPDQQEAEPERGHERQRPAGELRADQGQVRGAGRAVDQGDAVEQEARGERADQEVLERRFGGERRWPGCSRPGRRPRPTSPRARGTGRSGPRLRPGTSCPRWREGSGGSTPAPAAARAPGSPARAGSCAGGGQQDRWRRAA